MTNISRHRVLCVDADMAWQGTLSRTLTQYELVFVARGFEGLKMLNARAFDAYLLEFWLPDWSGAGFCRDIRARDPHAPIIFCATATGDAQVARGLRAGATAYFVKPVDPELLRSELHVSLAQANQASVTAKFEEECAIQDELQRRTDYARHRTDAARDLSASALERTTRIKAMKAFIDSRGSLADFERWWPTVYAAMTANHMQWHRRDEDDFE